MRKTILIIVALAVAIGLGVWWLSKSKIVENIEKPSHQDANLVGYAFMVDFFAIAPPISDGEAADRVYEALSSSAKEKVSRDNISSDMATFVGVQDIPDQGMDIKDLQVNEEDRVTLVLELKYSGEKTTRGVNMVIEGNEWKIDSITKLDEPATERGSYDILAVEETVYFASMKFGVAENEIEVVSIEEKEWPDGCLGLAGPEEICTQAIVPGYEIILMVEGEYQVFRSDEDGMVIRHDETTLLE
jgi:hypothetical protein